MEFTKLSDLEKYLDKKVVNSLHNNVKPFVIKTMKSQVCDVVYGAGEPRNYNRLKENGGLSGSIDNVYGDYNYGHNIKIGSNDNLLSYHPSWSSKYKGYDFAFKLNKAIVYGSPLIGNLCGYGFWTEPRDYITPTKEIVNNEAIKQMEHGLCEQGLNVKYSR